MKFSISRTKGRSNEQPCKAAAREGEDWVITLDTLEQLMALVKETDDIIVSEASDDPCWRLEIYDGYRE